MKYALTLLNKLWVYKVNLFFERVQIINLLKKAQLINLLKKFSICYYVFSVFLFKSVNVSAQQKKYIQHPEAAKGLQLIDRDGAFYYRTERVSNNDRSSSVRFGSLQPTPNIETDNSISNYKSIYGSANPLVVSYDYEWKPWKKYGSLGLQLGLNMFTGTGQGVFTKEDTVNNENEAKEKFSFFAVPVNVGLAYRLEYLKNQWLAPYVAGGGSVIGFAEIRDDNKSPVFAGTFGVYGAGGVLINVSAIDRETGFNLDVEYGIHTMWLTAEVRQLQVTNKQLDISGTMLTLGFAMDY